MTNKQQKTTTNKRKGELVLRSLSDHWFSKSYQSFFNTHLFCLGYALLLMKKLIEKKKKWFIGYIIYLENYDIDDKICLSFFDYVKFLDFIFYWRFYN